MTPERPKVHRCTQTEPFLHCVTQYIMEHPATVMLLLGIDPMANLGPVLAPTVDFYETRGRRQSVLEQIAESENGSQSPSSAGSVDRLEPLHSPSGSAKELDIPAETQTLLDRETKITIMKRSRHSASDLSEASERLLANRSSHPSSRSLKFNINT